MGALLKSLSVLLARQQSTPKKPTSTPVTDANLQHQQQQCIASNRRHVVASRDHKDATSSQRCRLALSCGADINPPEASCVGTAKRKSSEPEVEKVKRASSVSSDDSGVERDRSLTMSQDDITRTADGVSKCVAVREQNSANCRQVGFQDDVVVHTSSFVDVDGDRKEVTECRMLRMSSFQRERKLERAAAARNSSVDEPAGQAPKPEPPTCWTASADCVRQPEARYAIVREPRTGARLLRLTVRLGPSFAGGAPVMVKTNSSGTKVHLLAHRLTRSRQEATTSAPRKSKSDSAVYRDAFPLPVVVDPERVTATVDTDGRVTVEALIVAPSDPVLERWDRHQASAVTSRSGRP